MENETNNSVNIETNSLTQNDLPPEQENKSDFKETIIKAVALVLCAVLVIFTISKCFEKATQNNKDVADQYTAAPESDDSFAAAFDDSGDSDIPAGTSDDTADAIPADTADDVQASADVEQPAQAETPAADTETPSQSGSKPAPAAQQASAAKAPSTKAEILNYFNTAINKVKPGAKSITQTLEKNYQAKSIDLGSLGVAKGIVNSLIEKNMGINKEKTGKTATTLEEKNKLFPVENETWSSKLTLDDIKDAKLTEQGGNYLISITVKDDAPAATIKHGQSHHARAFSVVMPQTIKENAGGAASFLKDLKVGNSDGKINVKIDKATGHVTYASYDFVWSLGVSSFGGITAYFGIIQNFDIKW